MEMLLNYPVNLGGLKTLITSPDEQYLVWPDSHVPFREAEWLEKLDCDAGHRSYYCMIGGEAVGHIAIRKTDVAHIMRIVFVVVAPAHRKRGIGHYMLDEIEKICVRERLAEQLTLRVRSYNKIAQSLYQKCGYRVYAVEGTAIDMEKHLIDRVRFFHDIISFHHLTV
ncbi:GNAT family N-acetyltransferase [candidate division KSB1 bacterium]|nr:GNAT family N-acetyltransferase [candidate division KSB1 bacterium]